MNGQQDTSRAEEQGLYYRALPNVTTVPTHDRYVAEVRYAFDWVSNMKDATRDYRQPTEFTQQQLRDQHGINTELVEVPDPKLMMPKYVLCRKES